jgi:hypothetical protein
VAHPQIAAFARLAEHNALPTRRIAGQATKLSRTMHAIRYDEPHDEFVVGNPFSQAVLTFRGGADGEEAPRRVIQGPLTGMIKPDRVDVDPVHDEIIVPEPESRSILFFPRTASGNVAPVRVMNGDEYGWTAGEVSVDTVHDLLVATGTYGTGRARQQAILIFNRGDRGSVRPRAVISGPHVGLTDTRQIQVYPPGGWIVVVHPGRAGVGGDEKPENIFVGVWSIEDRGDVPPRWKIGGPASTLISPRGVVLNPKTEDVIVADMRLNAVLTYHFPELFAAPSSR